MNVYDVQFPVADNFGWREDSSGSEEHDAPHYPLDLRLAEARYVLYNPFILQYSEIAISPF